MKIPRVKLSPSNYWIVSNFTIITQSRKKKSKSLLLSRSLWSCQYFHRILSSHWNSNSFYNFLGAVQLKLGRNLFLSSLSLSSRPTLHWRTKIDHPEHWSHLKTRKKHKNEEKNSPLSQPTIVRASRWILSCKFKLIIKMMLMILMIIIVITMMMILMKMLSWWSW